MDALRRGSGPPERALDVAVAVEVAGFRWVTWDRVALGGLPVGSGEPFLASPDDPLAHLHRPAEPTVPPSGPRLAGVPDFSRDLDAAVAAAEQVGLFRDGRATLSRELDGTWVVAGPGLPEGVRGGGAAEAICRAALDWVKGRVAT